MRKHVIQFEISVPDKLSQADLITKLNAILDLLEHDTGKLQIDPQPKIQRVPYPVPTPNDQEAKPYIPPWTPPYKPQKPYSPSIGDPPPWTIGDQIYKRYKNDNDGKQYIQNFKKQLEKINNLVDKR